MRVTCICVCHNKPEIAHEAIESIVNQSHPNWEALVVDSGVLYDSGYFDQFSCRDDPRVKLIRSEETEEIRRSKAMAPWCFNECFRKGLVSGDLVMYLCDDDILYPNAFETFVSFSRRNPHAKAMYASQDIAVIYPTGWRAIVGERRATMVGGKCCDGRRMDCHVDYLQLCHTPEALKFFPDEEYWPESKNTESHADGIFMERMGEHVQIHPIDVKVSQNRRSLQSTYDPVRPFAMIECMANGIPLTAMRQDGERVGSALDNTTAPPHHPAAPFEKYAPEESGQKVQLVTVGLTGCSNEDRLRETLASLEAQTYPHLEILVIEDSSANRLPADVVRGLKAQYPRFRFISSDAMRDRGLWHGHGDYFISMDAGTLACPDMVERFVAELRARPGVSALTCYVLAVGRGAGDSPAHSVASCTARTASMKNIYGGGIFHTASFRAVGGYGTDLNLGGLDWAGFLKLVNAGYQVGILPEHLFYFGNGEKDQNGVSDAHLLQPFLNADRLAAAERIALWDALAGLQQRLEEVTVKNRQRIEHLTNQNHALRTRLGTLRYRVADRLNAFCARLPVARQSVKWFLSMLT
jgi:glycosyltransferase involved in cell wall biosynthesis